MTGERPAPLGIRRSLSWMALAQGTSITLQFASSVVLARFLTPYETGIYAVALAVVGVLALLQTLGLRALIVREEVLTPELARTAFTVNAAISVFLAAATLGVSVGLGDLFDEPGVSKALLGLAVTPLFAILTFLPLSQLERNGQFKQVALAYAVAGTINAITTIVLAANGFSFMSIVYAQWAGGLANVVAAHVLGGRYQSFRLGLTAWRRVASFGAQMMAVSGITSLSSRLSDLAVGRILGLSELGIMSRATALNGLLWNNIHMVVGRVLLVDFSALHREGTPLRERYIRTVEISTAVLWPAFGGIAMLAAPLIAVVYGERWVPAAHPLQLLAVASMIQVSISMTWELFAATGNLRTQTRIEFIRTSISLTLFVGACFVSLEAAVATRIIDAFLALALYRRHVDAMTSTRTRDFVRPYAVSALLTVLAVGPATVLAISTGFSSDVAPGWLAGSALGGVALWVLGLRLLRHPLADDLWPLSRRRRPAPSGPVSEPETSQPGSVER